jgi:hypothetical protein
VLEQHHGYVVVSFLKFVAIEAKAIFEYARRTKAFTLFAMFVEFLDPIVGGLDCPVEFERECAAARIYARALTVPFVPGPVL